MFVCLSVGLTVCLSHTLSIQQKSRLELFLLADRIIAGVRLKSGEAKKTFSAIQDRKICRLALPAISQLVANWWDNQEFLFADLGRTFNHTLDDGAVHKFRKLTTVVGHSDVEKCLAAFQSAAMTLNKDEFRQILKRYGDGHRLADPIAEMPPHGLNLPESIVSDKLRDILLDINTKTRHYAHLLRLIRQSCGELVERSASAVAAREGGYLELVPDEFKVLQDLLDHSSPLALRPEGPAEGGLAAVGDALFNSPVVTPYSPDPAESPAVSLGSARSPPATEGVGAAEGAPEGAAAGAMPPSISIVTVAGGSIAGVGTDGSGFADSSTASSERSVGADNSGSSSGSDGGTSGGIGSSSSSSSVGGDEIHTAGQPMSPSTFLGSEVAQEQGTASPSRTLATPIAVPVAPSTAASPATPVTAPVTVAVAPSTAAPSAPPATAASPSNPVTAASPVTPVTAASPVTPVTAPVAALVTSPPAVEDPQVESSMNARVLEQSSVTDLSSVASMEAGSPYGGAVMPGAGTGELSEADKTDIEEMFQFLSSAGIRIHTARRAAQKMVLELNIGTITRLRNLLRRGTLRERLRLADLTDDDIDDIVDKLEQ